MPDAPEPELSLPELATGEAAEIVGLRDAGLEIGGELHATLAQRLLELGFVPGEKLTVVGRIWPGGDPLAVQLGRSRFALRRREAEAVRVRRLRP